MVKIRSWPRGEREESHQQAAAGALWLEEDANFRFETFTERADLVSGLISEGEQPV
jgi:hypothetical protein